MDRPYSIVIEKLEAPNGRIFESCETCGCQKDLYSLRLYKSSVIKPLTLCKKHMEEVYEVLKEWKEND